MARILYNVNIPRFFASHRMSLANAAAAAGHEVHVATSDDDQAQVARIKRTGLPFHPLPLAQHGTNPLGEARSLAAMVALYRRLQPDLVHHVSIKPVLYGGIAAQIAGVPAVVGAMSGLGYVFIDAGLKARLLRLTLQPLLNVALSHRNCKMIFQNPDDRQTFIELGLIAPSNAVLIRGSGVDTERFAPAAESEGTPVVLFAGRLMWRKGLGDFVHAARLLRDQAKFVVVGYAEDSSPDTVPRSQLEAWTAAGIIEWWGRRDDMCEVFGKSHIVCLPSTYGEGVPKVLIEAAACERAVVTTDTPGCREIVRHAENGLLIAPNDKQMLVEALARLIQDRTLRQEMGAKGRQLVLREFSLPLVIGQTLSLYGELLARRQNMERRLARGLG